MLMAHQRSPGRSSEASRSSRRGSHQQGALCGVAVQLGDVRHPWRPLNQVVLEWGDVQLVSSRSVQRSIKQFLAIAQINITRKRFDNSNILNRTN